MPALAPFHNTYRSTREVPLGELVLLHGWGLHSIVWDDIMPGLLAHFQVTVIDLPGMGQSPLSSADYTLDFLVDQVADIMPERAHVMGWSLGGLVALQLALRYPARVQSLVITGTSPRFTAAEGWPAAMPSEVLAKFSEVLREDEHGTLIRFLALNCKGSATLREDVRKLKDMLYFCGLPDGRALRGGLDILRDTDLRAQLAGVSVPLLMLFGEHDHLVPAAVQADIRALHPDARLATLSELAHVPFISAPELYLQAVADFYRELGIVR